MWQYNLEITKEELEALMQNGKIIIADEIETECDTCSFEINLGIQLILRDEE